MSVFGIDYAPYYDLFYADKDYGGEAEFVCEVINRHRAATASLLDLGCGSARHAAEFARAGLWVTGVDRSANMIARGHERVAQLPESYRGRVELAQGDATGYRSHTTYDAVVSLFHVVSYQTSNELLRGIFCTARSAILPGGIFIFDFWHGPAVLIDKPEVRVRRVANAEVEVIRLAEPVHLVDRNLVEVKYTFIAIDKKTRRAEERTETHVMRYLFLPEIEQLATDAGFELVEVGEWLSGRSLGAGSWSGYVAARAKLD